MGREKAMPLLYVILILALIIGRVVPFYTEVVDIQSPFITPFYESLFGNGIQYQNVSLFISAIFTIIIGLAMHLVINGLWVFEARNLMPVIICMLLLSSGAQLQLMSDAYFIPLLVLLTLLTIFSSEKIDFSNKKIFNISILIATGSIFSFYAIYMIPLFLGLFIFLRKVNLKLFLSVLVGIIIPYWILWAVLFLNNTPENFALYFHIPEIRLISIENFSQGYLIYIPGLTLLAIVAFLSFLKEYPKMKQNHRIIFLSVNFLAVYALIIFILGLIPLNHAMGMAIISFALLFTLFFQVSSKRVAWLFFTSYLILFGSSFIVRF